LTLKEKDKILHFCSLPFLMVKLNSFNCFSSTSEGALVKGQTPALVLGKVITSLILDSPDKIVNNLSIQKQNLHAAARRIEKLPEEIRNAWKLFLYQCQ